MNKAAISTERTDRQDSRSSKLQEKLDSTIGYLSIGIPLLGLLAIPGPLAADQDWTGPLGRHRTFYGQVSPSFVTASDGFGSRSYAADAAQSPSRIGFRTRLPEAMANFRFEIDLGFAKSNQFGQTTTPPSSDLSKGDIRWFDVSWALPRGQKLSIGQGSMATDNSATSDLSGTDVVTGVSVADMAGGFEFRTSGGTLSGITVKSAYKTFDGIRRVRGRYDTEIRNGLTFSVAAGAGYLQDYFSDEVYDMALRYKRNEGDLRMVGAIGTSVTRQDGLPTVYETVGSFSAMHKPSGWNITLSGGVANPGGRGGYFKLGRALHWFQWGDTSMSLDILFNRDSISEGSASTAWGAGLVQQIEAVNADVFLGVRNYDAETVATGSLHSVRAVQFGTRWRF